MTRASASTASADPPPSVRALESVPPYALRDDARRQELLDEWTAVVVGLDEPMQVWHGPSPCTVAADGPGAAAALVRDLAARAQARQTLLLPAAATPTGGLTPQVVGEGRRHVTLADDRVGRVLALTGWPAAITPGWLAAPAAVCHHLTLHLRPVPRPVAARLLRRRLSSLTSTAYVDAEAGRLADPDLAVAAETAEMLRDALARGTTRLLHVQTLLAITAATTEDLDAQQQHIADLLGAHLAAVTTMTWQQAPAWRATTQQGAPLAWPWRLLDAASVAATIPHPVGPPPQPPTGTLAGIDPESGTPLLVDRFQAHNPGRLVVGTSGAGKSYAAKLELLRHLATGAAAVVIDPEGEFGRLGDVVGGITLEVGEEPAGLDPVGLACRRGMAPAEGLSVLASWAAALLGEPLSGIDLALLDRALGVLRADRGPETADNNAGPTAADLLAVVADVAAHPPFTGADLAARLAPAASGSVADLFAPNPELADPPALVVFDLRAVPGRVRPAVMACVLAWAWAETVGAPVARRRLIVVDEAHLLLDDPPAAQLLAQFARRARKYGVALEVVTQRLSDFLGHPTGEAVLANAATKLLLGCEDHERAAVSAGLGLTRAEAALLRPGDRGRGLLITPTLRTPILVVAAEAEHELASSGPRSR